MLTRCADRWVKADDLTAGKANTGRKWRLSGPGDADPRLDMRPGGMLFVTVGALASLPKLT
jgi:hypothetical protein